MSKHNPEGVTKAECFIYMIGFPVIFGVIADTIDTYILHDTKHALGMPALVFGLAVGTIKAHSEMKKRGTGGWI